MIHEKLLMEKDSSASLNDFTALGPQNSRIQVQVAGRRDHG